MVLQPVALRPDRSRARHQAQRRVAGVVRRREDLDELRQGGAHSDHHALWINPEAPEQEIFGTDGGLYFSWDRGRTWDHVENIVVAQFYAIAVDDAQPFYNVYGGLQDNQSYGGPSRTRNSFGPTNADWFRMAGGDGFHSVPDHFDHNIVYTESQEGGLIRYDARIGQSKNIRPIADSGVKHRYNWSAPIFPSRHEPKMVYMAANYLFRSTDRGDNWTMISPDLTRAHRPEDAADARRGARLDGARPQRGHGGVRQHHHDRRVAAAGRAAGRGHR